MTTLCHPFCSLEMCDPASVGFVRLRCGVAIEHNPGDFTPVRAVRIGVEQPHIENQMRAIVGGDSLLHRGYAADRDDIIGHRATSRCGAWFILKWDNPKTG